MADQGVESHILRNAIEENPDFGVNYDLLVENKERFAQLKSAYKQASLAQLKEIKKRKAKGPSTEGDLLMSKV
jgi:hypothetical protein